MANTGERVAKPEMPIGRDSITTRDEVGAMQALTFWKRVVNDTSDFLERLLSLLEVNEIRFCVIGGQAVNAYVDPVVSLDLDLVVAVDQLATVEPLLRAEFNVERFPHSLNLASPGSNLRAQIQTDPRYFEFVRRAMTRDVLGVALPVAHVEDLLQGKLWAVTDTARRPSKRQKDLADIARLLDAYPALTEQVPPEVLDRLVR